MRYHVLRRKTQKEKNMLTLIFIFMMLGFVGKVLWLAFKATWGLTKVLMYIVFAPLMLVILFASGFAYAAFILLIIAGVSALIRAD